MKRRRTAHLMIALFFAPISFFFYKRATAVRLTFLVIFLIGLSGCFKNYLRIKSSAVTDSAVSRLKNSDKFIFLFTKNNVYQVRNIAANGDRIEADLQSVSHKDKELLYKGQSGSYSYKHRDKSFLFSQIHLITNLTDPADSTHIAVPLNTVSRVEVFEADGGKTVLSYVLGGLGVYAGISLVALIIVLISCNCPQVYTYDGAEYNFKSGVFSGAIYSSLERTDYLPLDGVQPYNGKFSFKLANNQREEQFINQLQLIEVKHAADQKVLLDRFGKPHTFALEPVLPQTGEKPSSLAEIVKYPDGDSYLFDKNEDAHSPNGSIILNFTNTNKSSEAKLVVHAKNSMWSGYIFNEFSGMFGGSYQKWIAKQDNADQHILEKWQLDQCLPLMVYVQSGKGWRFVDYFPFTGNTAGRDMMMSVPLPADAQNVKIKIESAYMFWELDYAAMDFSADVPVKVSYLNPSVAVTNNKESKITQLTSKDNGYVFLKEDDYLKVEFNNTAASAGTERSLFLSSTGYYHSKKIFTGKMQTANLYQFRKKGAFNRFSQSRFQLQQQALTGGINFKH